MNGLDDSECVRPEVPVIVFPLPLPGMGMWLTGEASRDEASHSSIESPVELTYITDDGSGVDEAVFDTLL